MAKEVKIGKRWVGEGRPVFITAEVGINHNGDVETAKRLAETAKTCGCDAVKFQKRTPSTCVPESQRNIPKETPWGWIPYFEYRKKIEFGRAEYEEIDAHARSLGIEWFASVWDPESVFFMEAFDPVAYKIPSAALTDLELLDCVKRTGRPAILSTGMSVMDQISRAVETLGTERLVILHSTSSYPCRPEELNLNMIRTYRDLFDCPIGYSGHEVGLATTLAAVVLGASIVERHITLDRAMWGTDQAASVEAQGFKRLVRDIRAIESAMGDGVKQVYKSEEPVMRRLRRYL